MPAARHISRVDAAIDSGSELITAPRVGGPVGILFLHQEAKARRYLDDNSLIRRGVLGEGQFDVCVHVHGIGGLAVATATEERHQSMKDS